MFPNAWADITITVFPHAWSEKTVMFPDAWSEIKIMLPQALSEISHVPSCMVRDNSRDNSHVHCRGRSVYLAQLHN